LKSLRKPKKGEKKTALRLLHFFGFLYFKAKPAGVGGGGEKKID